jgi:hypothetical protein
VVEMSFIGAGTTGAFKCRGGGPGIKDGISKEIGDVKSIGTSNIAGTEVILLLLLLLLLLYGLPAFETCLCFLVVE